MKHTSNFIHSNEFREQQQHFTSLVLQVASVEMIYFLGYTNAQTIIETLFNEIAFTNQFASQYFILVLIKKTDETNKNRIQDKIENKLQHFIPTTALILEIETFERWGKEGHPFACKANKWATILYNANQYSFHDFKEVDEKVIKRNNEEYLFHAKHKGQEFFAGADLFIIRKEYKIAAFLLHQAAEQILLALFNINTGLRLNTHNLDKLIRYCSMFLPEANELFPRRNEKEKRIFSLLQNAYIDVRYTNNYTIEYRELKVLREKIYNLNEVLQKSNRQLHNCKFDY